LDIALSKCLISNEVGPIKPANVFLSHCHAAVLDVGLVHSFEFLAAATAQKEKNKLELECGPMPNLMVALPNIGGALCSTPQSLADAHY